MAIQLYKGLYVNCEDKRRELESSDQDNLSNRVSRCTNNLCEGSVAGVYITTNESRADESIHQLMQKPKIAHACHIGFSGWHNFDIMASRHSEYGLICDFNPNNKKFIEATLLGLKKTKSREEFIKIMGFGCDKIFQGGVDFFSPNMSSELDGEDEILLPSEEISRDASKERSWLFSDESFNYIKELAVHGKIAVITEDIRHTETFQKVVRLYYEEGLVIDTIYTSNICDYMFTDLDKQAYASTVYSLIQPQTTLIHCPKQDGIRLQQQIVVGEDLLQDRNIDKFFTVASRNESDFFIKELVESEDTGLSVSPKSLDNASPISSLGDEDEVFCDALTSQNSEVK